MRLERLFYVVRLKLRGIHWVDDLIQDAGYGLRALRKSRGFTGVAVLSLGLGIGANTAIFSMVNAVLLQTLPVSRPEELVLLRSIQRNGAADNFAYPDYRQLRDRSSTFSGLLAASSVQPVDAGVGTESEQAHAEVVSANYFSGAGVCLGIPAVFAFGQLISSMLFGLAPWDPGIITLAAYVPARRASRIDPMAALRHE
jgi:hypothetical protein